jgi:hypothetical protein
MNIKILIIKYHTSYYRAVIRNINNLLQINELNF